MENDKEKSMDEVELNDFGNKITDLSMNHPGLISYLRDLNKLLNPKGIKCLRVEPQYEVIKEEDLE